MDNSELDYKPAGKCLVAFISQESLRGARRGHMSEKAKREIREKSSLLFREEVDLDVFVFEEYFRKLSKAGPAREMQPDFKLLRNHKYEEMNTFIKGLETEGYKYGSFVFVITSYLPKYSTSSSLAFELYDEDMTLDYFIDTMKSFPSMAAKPKIFLVQADNRALLVPEIFTKAGGFDEGPEPIGVKVPTDADRLVIFSTIPQRLSTLPGDATTDAGDVVSSPRSDPNASSFLMQALIEVLKMKSDTDLLCLTPSILGHMEKLIEDFKKTHTSYNNRKIELPLVMSTLTKRVILKKLAQQQE